MSRQSSASEANCHEHMWPWLEANPAQQSPSFSGPVKGAAKSLQVGWPELRSTGKVVQSRMPNRPKLKAEHRTSRAPTHHPEAPRKRCPED